MADNEYIRTAEIMKAAMPYVDIRTKLMIDLFSKLFDLMECYRHFTNKTDLAACGYEEQKMDMEGLLSAVRPLCNEKERAFIDQILSIYNAKRMFDTYNTYMNAMKAMQGFEGFQSGASDSGSNSENTGGNTSGFDFSSLFGNNFSGNKDSETGNTSGFDFSSLFGNNFSGNTDSTSGNGFGNIFGNNQSSDTGNASEHSEDSGANQGTQSENTGSNNMFDLLKGMIPPEQMSTFENLSMLFKTMSYDNNSKPDPM